MCRKARIKSDGSATFVNENGAIERRRHVGGGRDTKRECVTLSRRRRASSRTAVAETRRGAIERTFDYEFFLHSVSQPIPPRIDSSSTRYTPIAARSRDKSVSIWPKNRNKALAVAGATIAYILEQACRRIAYRCKP